MDTVTVVMLVVGGWVAYLLPALLAFHRHHPQRRSIAVINVVWAVSAIHHQRQP